MRTTTAERLKQIMSERSLRQVDIIKKSVPFQKFLHIKLGKALYHNMSMASNRLIKIKFIYCQRH